MQVQKSKVKVKVRGDLVEVDWISKPSNPEDHLTVLSVVDRCHGEVILSNGSRFSNPPQVDEVTAFAAAGTLRSIRLTYMKHDTKPSDLQPHGMDVFFVQPTPTPNHTVLRPPFSRPSTAETSSGEPSISRAWDLRTITTST